jgi:hypothetical protein
VRLHGHHAQHDRLDHNQRLLYVVLGPRQLRTGGDCPRGQQPIQLLHLFWLSVVFVFARVTLFSF